MKFHRNFNWCNFNSENFMNISKGGENHVAPAVALLAVPYAAVAVHPTTATIPTPQPAQKSTGEDDKHSLAQLPLQVPDVYDISLTFPAGFNLKSADISRVKGNTQALVCSLTKVNIKYKAMTCEPHAEYPTIYLSLLGYPEALKNFLPYNGSVIAMTSAYIGFKTLSYDVEIKVHLPSLG